MASLLEFCNQAIHIHLPRRKQAVKVTSALLKFCQISTRGMRDGGKKFIGPHPGVWLC